MKLSLWPIALMVLALAAVTTTLELRARRSTALEDAERDLRQNAVTIHRLDSIGQTQLLANRDLGIRLTASETRTRQLLAELQAADTVPMDTVHIAGDTTARYAVPIPTVLKWQALGANCSALMHDCDAVKAGLEAQIQTLQAELALSKSSTRIATTACVDAARPGLLERLTSRVGVTVGYGATAAGGHLDVGPQITAGVRLWP